MAVNAERTFLRSCKALDCEQGCVSDGNVVLGMKRALRAWKFFNYCSDPACNWTLWQSDIPQNSLKGKKETQVDVWPVPGEYPWGKGFGAEGNLRVVFLFNSNFKLSFVVFLMSSPCYQISFGREKVNSGVLGQTGKFPVPSLGQNLEPLRSPDECSRKGSCFF